MTYSMKVMRIGSKFSVNTTFPPSDSLDYVMMRADQKAEEEDVLYVEVLEDGEVIDRMRGEGANTKES